MDNSTTVEELKKIIRRDAVTRREALPATVEQLSDALEVVAKVAGLETKVSALGEASGEGRASSAAVQPGTPSLIPGVTSTPG